jgi:predicted transcriptional regulator
MIELAKNLRLPEEAVTETFGIIAMKGKGKTYTGTKLFEEMYAAGAQCVALDPIGNWRYLRVAGDGKGKGLDIPVFGGPHGDLPLLPDKGALIARVVVERHLSLVLDLSRFSKPNRKRFATDFAVELFELKKDDTTYPMHLFVEEARMFVPQKMLGKQDAHMVDAFDDIVRLGRNYGIGCSLIDQRPQSVNKDVLSQVSVLIALGLSGKLERKEIEDWVRMREVDGAEALVDLPTLGTGDAFAWSPAFFPEAGLPGFSRIHIAKKKTFDGSATPKMGQHGKIVDTKPLSGAEVEALKAAMTEVIEEANQQDPTHMRGALADAKRQLAEANVTVTNLRADLGLAKETLKSRPAGKVKAEYVEVPVIKDADYVRLGKLFERIGKPVEEILRRLDDLRSTVAVATSKVPKSVEAFKKTEAELQQYEIPKHQQHAQRALEQLDAGQVRHPASLPMTEGAKALGKKQRQILGALAARERHSPGVGVTRSWLALRVVMSQSGTYTNYLSELSTHGLIEKAPEGGYRITPAGLKCLNAPAYDTPTGELINLWSHRFTGRVRDMLMKLHDVYPSGLTRTKLAETVGMSESGTFTNYLSELNTAGLIQKHNNQITLSSDLYT